MGKREKRKVRERERERERKAEWIREEMKERDR